MREPCLSCVYKHLTAAYTYHSLYTLETANSKPQKTLLLYLIGHFGQAAAELPITNEKEEKIAQELYQISLELCRNEKNVRFNDAYTLPFINTLSFVAQGKLQFEQAYTVLPKIVITDELTQSIFDLDVRQQAKFVFGNILVLCEELLSGYTDYAHIIAGQLLFLENQALLNDHPVTEFSVQDLLTLISDLRTLRFGIYNRDCDWQKFKKEILRLFFDFESLSPLT